HVLAVAEAAVPVPPIATSYFLPISTPLPLARHRQTASGRLPAWPVFPCEHGTELLMHLDA
ncbi:MAG TPA: hypothetical protein VGE93_18590, partial [Bryobacteraceae bacterium]